MPPLFHDPGEPPSKIGEGRGVISVIAARAGELKADLGDNECDEFMLVADNFDRERGRSMAIG